MRAHGFTLVEIVVGLLLLGLALGGGLALLRGVSTKAGAEGAALLAGEKARQAVEGLSKELSGMQAALLLYGDTTSANLVAAFPPGLPVLRQGYKPGEALVQTSTPLDLQNGAVFLAPTGEAFYAPTATLEPVSSTTYRIRFPEGCPNPLPFTEGLRLYRATPLELSFDGSVLSFSAPGVQEKLSLKDFRFRYVYVNRAGREVALPDYRGASYQENNEDLHLSYLGLYAQAKSGSISRDAALRIPTARQVNKVLTCGSQTPGAAGTGVVSIVIKKTPYATANVADITLTAQGGYVRRTDRDVVYADVPAGPFTVLAKERAIGPGGIAIWRPEGNREHEYEETATTFVPKKVTVNYQLAKGTIRIESVTLPDGTTPEDFQGRLVWRGDSWSPADSFTFNSRGGSFSVNPGTYEFDLGWELVSSTPPLPVQVASDQTVSLRLVVKPGPLLLRLIVREPENNDLGLKPLICIWPDNGSNLIPSDAEVNKCPTDSR